MQEFDAIVIGSGISGACTARELARWQLRTAVLEKDADFCAGATKGNSATVHSGHDAAYGTKKAYYNVRGNAMYDDLCRELSVPFRRNGTIVFAASETELAEVRRLKENADKNGVPGVQVLDREGLERLEPGWGETVLGALYAPTGGMVCPYTLTFALCENAHKNGVRFFRNAGVRQIVREDSVFILTTDAGQFRCRYLFNCAGTHADEMNNFVSSHKITIQPRRGSHIILDRKLAPHVHATLCQTPADLSGGGHTKGMGLMPTMDGTLLLGCEAVTVENRDNTATTREGLDEILNYFRANWAKLPISRAIPVFPQQAVIGAFAGLRPHPTGDDYILGEPDDCPRFCNLAGIESPGLTAAPAIARELVQQAAQRYGWKANGAFDPLRRAPKPFRLMNFAERERAIAADADYGAVICRCEMVTRAEVLAAIRGELGARSVNAVKMRVRAGMGRCQGGFCGPEVVRLLSEELGIPMTEVLQAGQGSNVLLYETCSEALE